MNSLVLSVGITVTFLIVWGVIMVGGYLLGREPANAPTAAVTDRTTDIAGAIDSARLG